MGSASVTPGLADVQMISARTGFAVATTGTTTLLATSDGGRTWTSLYQAPDTIMGIAFLSASTGYLVEASCPANGNPCTDTTLVQTTDGGRTWSHAYTFGARSVSIDFVDPREGWALTVPVGAPGPDALLHTVNGGTSWTAVSDPSSTPGFPQSISFISASAGWLLAGGEPSAGNQGKTLYRTTDGGRTWTTVTSVSIGSQGGLPSAGYVTPDGGLDFLSPSTGFMALERGGLFVTRDGGRTWTEAVDPAPGADDARVGFWSSTGGYLWEGFGAASVPLYLTANGGRHWTEVYPPTAPMVAGPIPGSSVWLGFGDLSGNPSTLIEESGNQGLTWTPLGTAPAGTEILHALSTQILVGSTGTAVVTSRDGGRRWTTVTFPEGTLFLETLSFADPRNGWAFAPGGLYTTRDGGVSWSLKLKPSALPFGPEVLVRTSLDTAYALGPSAAAASPSPSSSSGKPLQKNAARMPPNDLWVTRNGGRTWTPYRIPTADFVGGLSAVGPSVIVWSPHHYWVSDDAGAHWRAFSWPQGWTPGAVSAMGGAGFVTTVGTDGGLGQAQYISHDDGASWAPIP